MTAIFLTVFAICLALAAFCFAAAAREYHEEMDWQHALIGAVIAAGLAAAAVVALWRGWA